MSTDPLTMMQSQVAHILSENLELRSRVSALEVTVGSLLKGEFNGKEQECGEGMKPSPEDMAVTSLTVPLSPKTRMIFEMEDEREQQETALQQIEEGYAETRQCPAAACSKEINEKCFRKNHFNWCTMHERMTDDDGTCPENSKGDEIQDLVACREVRCDMTEEEAYWAEVGENAIKGGAGFREPGEPHIH